MLFQLVLLLLFTICKISCSLSSCQKAYYMLLSSKAFLEEIENNDFPVDRCDVIYAMRNGEPFANEQQLAQIEIEAAKKQYDTFKKLVLNDLQESRSQLDAELAKKDNAPYTEKLYTLYKSGKEMNELIIIALQHPKFSQITDLEDIAREIEAAAKSTSIFPTLCNSFSAYPTALEFVQGVIKEQDEKYNNFREYLQNLDTNADQKSKANSAVTSKACILSILLLIAAAVLL